MVSACLLKWWSSVFLHVAAEVDRFLPTVSLTTTTQPKEVIKFLASNKTVTINDSFIGYWELVGVPGCGCDQVP